MFFCVYFACKSAILHAIMRVNAAISVHFTVHVGTRLSKEDSTMYIKKKSALHMKNLVGIGHCELMWRAVHCKFYIRMNEELHV